MMDETLFCPFTRQPCMGRDCACAVYATRGAIAYGLTRRWWCGLVPYQDEGCQPPIDEEPMDEEPNDNRKD